MNLRIDLEVLLRRNVPLSGYCTMKVGGPADCFAEPERETDLVDLLDYAARENLSWMVLGKGSNVIFPDEGWPGLVISLARFEQDRIVFDSLKPVADVSGGIQLHRFALACCEHGMAGAEFLANIPGTIGGALVMNAGFSRFRGQTNEIGDLVRDVTVLNADGTKETLAREQIEFSYRRSSLKGKIVLSARLALWRRPKDKIRQEIAAGMEHRNHFQDLRYPSCGSVFKNPKPPAPKAAQLIDKVGLKGARIGGAMVSDKHANYIVNVDHAKSSDVLELIEKIRKTVLDATEVLLEPEIRIIKRP